MSIARAREKPEMFLQTASHRGYIKTTTLPPLSRVSLAKKCSHAPSFAQIFAPMPLTARNPSPRALPAVRSSDLGLRSPHVASPPPRPDPGRVDPQLPPPG